MTNAPLKSAKRNGQPKAQDATALLRADHKRVAALFASYKGTRSTAKKRKIVSALCAELSVHAQVEEEIFYPAVKLALKDKELVPEASVEHETLKALISQVEGVEPEGELFDARIKVMSEYVRHHVKEEQSEMFPRARATHLDMKDLGCAMAARKKTLLAERAGGSPSPMDDRVSIVRRLGRFHLKDIFSPAADEDTTTASEKADSAA